MEKEILELIEDGALYSEIYNKTSLEENKLNIILEHLMHTQKIFRDNNGVYRVIRYPYVVKTLEHYQNGIMFVEMNDKKINIPSGMLHTAMKDDVIVLDQSNLSVEAILERKNKKLVCEVSEVNGKPCLIPFNTNCNIAIECKKGILNTCLIGDRVVAELDNEIDYDNTVYINNFTNLGHCDDDYVDEISIAQSKGFNTEFPKAVLDETELIKDHVTEDDKKGRLDLTSKTIFTIDSVHTKDMDDAISIEKLDNGTYMLGVHIADVPYYVKPGSKLFEEAMDRSTSVYIGEAVVPMLPRKLSNGICSLNEGVDRLTKTVFINIDQKGNIINYRIFRTVINSKKKMAYEELDKYLTTGEIDDSYKPFIPEIGIMRELSNIMTSNKIEKGNLTFKSEEISIKKEADDFVFQRFEGGESEHWIENFMIAANECIATEFARKNWPFIYRVHDNPDETRLRKTVELLNKLDIKITEFENKKGKKELQSILSKYMDDEDYGTVISLLILRSMAKAKYSTKNTGHYALSLDNYCHFTSPIRRSPDSIVHLLMNHFLFDEEYDKDFKQVIKKLDEFAEHASYKERQADDAEKDFAKLRMAQYIKKHANEEFEATIINIDKKGIMVKLDNNIKGYITLEEGLLRDFKLDLNNKELVNSKTKLRLHLGSKLVVKAYIVNIGTKEITFYATDSVELRKQEEAKIRKRMNKPRKQK